MPSPWREALDAALAAHADDPTSRYVALATNARTDYPAVRTVVFRGLDAEDRLRFAVDRRSEKVAELRADRHAEVAWYFPRTRQQFRLRGLVQIAGEGAGARLGAVREDVWRSLSDAVRAQFTWPRPGDLWAGEEGFRGPSPDPERPSPDFAVLILEADRIDVLDLRTDPPTRVVYEPRRAKWLSSATEWKSWRVNP